MNAHRLGWGEKLVGVLLVLLSAWWGHFGGLALAGVAYSVGATLVLLHIADIKIDTAYIAGQTDGAREAREQARAARENA